ncbi:MAG: BMC domain-containing protein [Myxococcota bacterium]|nr:BMC domain-containing protein [Myxococcota bacterium]
MAAPGPALAMLDVGDVPPALLALDALAKEAMVELIGRGTIQPGRFAILFAGEVEAVERSYRKALPLCHASVCDSVLLPHAEQRLVPAIRDGVMRWPAPGDTLGVIQLGFPPTLLRAVDAALKGAHVDLVQLRLGDGLGGRGIALLWGETHDVEAALELAEAAAFDGCADSLSTSIIRNADDEVIAAFGDGTTFFKEWRG